MDSNIIIQCVLVPFEHWTFKKINYALRIELCRIKTKEKIQELRYDDNLRLGLIIAKVDILN